MPQMMPLNWLFLFIFFLLIFINFNMLNYFIFQINPKNNNNLNNFKKKNFFWKW